MRFFSLMVVAVASSVQCIGQQTEAPWKLNGGYVNIGGISQSALPNSGLKSNMDVGIGVAVTARNGAGTALHMRACSFRARNKPADYNAGTSWDFFGDDEPLENAVALSASVLYKWSPLRKPILRMSFEAGPALVIYNRAVFTPQAVTTSGGGGFFAPARSSNYTYTLRSETHPAYNTALRLEALLTRHVGLSFGVWKNFNTAINLMGSETSLIVGVLRPKQKISQ